MRKALKFAPRVLWFIAGALLLAGCGSGHDAPVNIVTIGEPSSPFEKGVRMSPPARLVRGAIMQGLVGFDEHGQVVPGLAERWIIADDGLSYIFRLRDGTWADGSPLTAQTVRTSLREAMAALRKTPFALDLAGIDEIRVMTERVVEIRLVAPMPNLLQLLAQPELGLARKGRGTGPMRLRREGNVAVLTVIPPGQRGLPVEEGWQDTVRPLRLTALPAEAAVDMFNSGAADVLLGGRIEHFPLAQSVGLIRGTIQLDPAMGLFGLSVVEADGFLAAPANREAVAMAIDREGLITPFGVGGWVATTRIVAPGLADDPGMVGERWVGLTLAERQAQAAARVSRWREAQPEEEPIRLRIALPQGPGGDLLFERFRLDLSAIGIEARRVALDDDADLRLLDVVASYPRLGWFLNQLSCLAKRGLCSEEADRLAAEALRATDPALRAELAADAEAELTKANVFIPLGAPIRWSMVRGNAAGFAANRSNVHPLMPMALRPK